MDVMRMYFMTRAVYMSQQQFNLPLADVESANRKPPPTTRLSAYFHP
jgi:hypothetical protein